MNRFSQNRWILAARPRTLWAAVAPVLIGGAIAFESGAFNFLMFIPILLAAVLIQIGTNYANDLYDYLKEADTGERLGPLRAVQSGLISVEEMKKATAVVFILAVALGYILFMRAGWVIVVIGLSSLLWGWLYTAGPLPLGYIGLAELFVLFYFGPVAVAGTTYVLSLQFSWNPFLAGVAPGLLSTALLVVNNLRDIPTDSQVGKRTLAVRMGEHATRFFYLMLVLIAVVGIPLLLHWKNPEHPFIMISSGSLLYAIKPIRIVYTCRGRELNQALAQTSMLLLVYSLLFVIGWLL